MTVEPTIDPSELWIVAWRHSGRRDKSEKFTSKANATDRVRELLASDVDFVVLSREELRVTLKVTHIKQEKA